MTDDIFGVNEDNRDRGIALLNRRTAVLGAAGIASGGLFGYRTFFATDEPAFAFSDLQLTGEGITIATVDGNVASVAIDGSQTEIAFEYINFQESQVGDGVDEFDVTLGLASADLGASEETIFETTIDAGALPSDEIVSSLDGDLGVSSILIDDHSQIELGDFEPADGVGESATTTLEFTLAVAATSYDTVSSEATVQLDVTVTTIDEDDIEIAVGGHIVLGGEAENAPQTTD
ncbi:hypothetical protein [Natrialba sp. PRR66]|uniref:hypothetical protein n=1 Tax=Natrialba sp. PRR66 TaxID=3098146 RepID=UPI002B1D928B|nr:hypothetical protein [Natrialba sp. PRR66]